MVTIKFGSSVTSLENIAPSNSVLTVYPNPTNQSLTILNTTVEEINQVLLFDISGRLITTFGKTIELDLSIIHSGMYLLQINKTNGGVLSTRIIKE
mgnify:CR=1 FL=1